MPARRDSRFLPVFFTVLSVVFVIAVFVKLRSYTPASARETTTARTTTTAKPQTNTVAPTATTSSASKTTTYEIVPDEPAASRREVASSTPSAPQGLVDMILPQQPVQSQPQPLVRVPSATGSPSIPSRSSAASRPATSPAQQQQQQNRSQSSSSNGTQSASSTTKNTSGGTKETPADNDPSSDTQPPQLVSIDFTPNQIQDGQDTQLAIVANDNMSGVRVISGTIASPTGGLQGFAVQREGETSRYSTRISVPKDAPEGLWRVMYLSLSDNAGNTATLSANQGTLANAGFRVVSSQSDTKAPTLRAVWLDRVSMRAGEKNVVFVQADDEGTGVSVVSGVFQSPSKFARIGFGCHPGDQAWSCDFVPPASADCGEWKLEQIQLQDKANNMATVRSDNQLVAAVRLTMGGSDCDSQPPQMQTIVLDRNVVSNAAKSSIGVIAQVSDDMSGVASITGQVTGPSTTSGTPRLYFSLAQGQDPNTWTGQIVVPAMAAKGQWEIAWVQILDKANNLKTYSRTDPVLRTAVFNVQ